jgi:hypothetical protein
MFGEPPAPALSMAGPAPICGHATFQRWELSGPLGISANSAQKMQRAGERSAVANIHPRSPGVTPTIGSLEPKGKEVTPRTACPASEPVVQPTPIPLNVSLGASANRVSIWMPCPSAIFLQPERWAYRSRSLAATDEAKPTAARTRGYAVLAHARGLSATPGWVA